MNSSALEYQAAVSRYHAACARTDTLLDSLPPLGADEDDSLDDTLPGDDPDPEPVTPPPQIPRERL